MTEKNADVQWLRAAQRDAAWQFPIDVNRAHRLLAHIDQLEADTERLSAWLLKAAALLKEQEASKLAAGRPTVHEIAAQMMAALVPVREG